MALIQPTQCQNMHRCICSSFPDLFWQNCCHRFSKIKNKYCVYCELKHFIFCSSGHSKEQDSPTFLNDQFIICVIFSVKRGHTFPGFSFSVVKIGCFSLSCAIKRNNNLKFFFPLCWTKQDIWWQVNGKIHQKWKHLMVAALVCSSIIKKV